MEQRIAYIYVIINLISGKKYVGFTTNPEKRKLEHFSKRSRCPYISNAIKKYGKDNFLFKILYQSKNINITLKEKEEYYIRKYNTYYPNGYNLTFGGEGSIGRILSEETKEKISNSLCGHIESIDTRKKKSESKKGNKNSFYGKIHTDETKEKIGVKNRSLWEYTNNVTQERVIIDNLKAFCKNRNLSYYMMTDSAKGNFLYKNEHFLRKIH